MPADAQDDEKLGALETEDGDPLAQPRLGRALRALREARGHSRNDVSRETGLSGSFLALVETGRSDLSIGRLRRLLKFYGTHLTELLPRQQAESVVTRRGERYFFHLSVGGSDISGSLLTPDGDRRMMPILVDYGSGSRTTDLPMLDRESFVYVLEGSLTIERKGLEPVLLEEGDSAYFKTANSIAALASDDGARVLIVIDPPAR
jgi:transcriptional regulator with XRE-family HTH domain